MEKEQYFSTRRTIRRYDSDRHVSDAELTRMIELAAQAPNTGNMQLYSVIVTRDEDAKKRLAPAHFNQPSATGADAVLTFCADFNRFEKWCEARNAQPGYDNFQSLMWAVIDTTIFAQQFCTIAEMNGLGTCYLGTTTYNAPMIADILGLPSRVVPVVTLTVGYPAADAEISDRIPVEGIMHNERYEDYDTARINALYHEKEQREDSKRFIAENNKETLAQVFTDVRYTRDANEHFSEVLSEFIKKQGF
ncbi:MAG: nitroreductase family protein [Duncaniella sp.]|nr:nitroreductase family protein [Duncaniella sp.]